MLCPHHGFSFPGLLTTPPGAGTFPHAFPRRESPFAFPVLPQYVASVRDDLRVLLKEKQRLV